MIRLGRIRAFSLVEVVLALGVTAFCLTALLALLPLGLQSNQDSAARKLALGHCGAIEAELRSANWTSPQTSWVRDLGLRLPDTGEPAQTVEFFDRPDAPGFSPARVPESRFKFRVTLLPPSSEPARAVLHATWPAAAPEGKNAIHLLIGLESP